MGTVHRRRGLQTQVGQGRHLRREHCVETRMIKNQTSKSIPGRRNSRYRGRPWGRDGIWWVTGKVVKGGLAVAWLVMSTAGLLPTANPAHQVPARQRGHETRDTTRDCHTADKTNGRWQPSATWVSVSNIKFSAKSWPQKPQPKISFKNNLEIRMEIMD